jgi:hypothetical protein
MTDQMPLFERVHRFDGDDYVPARDYSRLKGQLLAIVRKMLDGKWWSVERMAEETGFPAQSISAQFRNLRKPENGGMVVPRKQIDGLSCYQLTADDIKTARTLL